MAQTSVKNGTQAKEPEISDEEDESDAEKQNMPECGREVQWLKQMYHNMQKGPHGNWHPTSTIRRWLKLVLGIEPPTTRCKRPKEGREHGEAS